MGKLQPKLRFPEFKEEWIKEKFGVIANNKSGKYNPEKEKISQKCIELEHIEQETGRIIGYSDSLGLASIKNKFKQEDVLFGKLRPYLRKHVLAPFEGVCSSEIWVLSSKIISNKFLFRIVESERFIDIANQSTGSKMPRADWSAVSETYFNYPSLQEQNKIAAFLSAVDEKLNLLKEKKADLEEYKKGMMQKIFSQEIQFKNENGEDFEKWEEKSLGEICDVKKGSQLNKDTLTESGLYPCISGGIEPSGYTFEYNRLENSIIISEGGNSCGYVNFITTKFWCGGHCYTIDLKDDSFDNIFLFQALKYYQDEIMKLRVGSGLPNIQKKDLLKFNLILSIDIEEQTKIASFLSTIDKKINLVHQQIEDTKEYKKGLLQGMFC
jgi:type I restriction enzyme S subunit